MGPGLTILNFADVEFLKRFLVVFLLVFFAFQGIGNWNAIKGIIGLGEYDIDIPFKVFWREPVFPAILIFLVIEVSDFTVKFLKNHFLK